MRNSKVLLTIGLAILVALGAWWWLAGKKQASDPVKGDQTVNQSSHAERIMSLRALRDEAFVLSGQTEWSMMDVVEDLNGGVSLEFTGETFDSASGALTIEGVNVKFPELPGLVLSADQMVIWGTDPNFLKARLNGERLNDTGMIAKRVEFHNLSMSGVDKVINAQMDKIFSDEFEDMADEAFMRFDGYTVVMEFMVMTDIELHPWKLRLTDTPNLLNALEHNDDNPDQPHAAWHGFQKLAAMNVVYSVDEYAAYNTQYTVKLSQMGNVSDANMSVGFTAGQGFDRGDFDFAVVEDFSHRQSSEVPNFQSDEVLTMSQGGETKFISGEDIRLRKIYEHFAQGKFPDKSETDFMSLGRYVFGPSTSTMNDELVATVESQVLDVSSFHGMFPTKIDMTLENMRYYPEALFNMFEAMGMVGNDAEVMEVVDKLKGVLDEADVGDARLDARIKAEWSPVDGKNAFDYNLDIQDWGGNDFSANAKAFDYDVAYDLVSRLISDPENFEPDLDFLGGFELHSVTNTMQDSGGLERGFELAAAFAKAFPDEPAMAGIRSSSPAQLREMMAGSLYLSVGAIAQTFPPGVEYVEALSNFIKEGGTLEFEMKPSPALKFETETSEQLEMMLQSDPEAAAKRLGIRVEHKKTP